jgi:predicted transcriptional regulator
MNETFHERILREFGFEKIAEIAWGFPLQLWWHADQLIQVSEVNLSPYHLIKATKSYYMKGITQEGEVHSRDLGSFQSYLESHFPEIHISVSNFRDINHSMILRRIADRRMRDASRVESLSLEEKEAAMNFVRDEFDKAKKGLVDTESFMRLAGSDSSLLNTYLKDKYRRQKMEIEQLSVEGKRIQGELLATRRLLEEYGKKGIATAFVFTHSSNLHGVLGRDDFRDALASAIKEVRDAHHYEIRQKLGGRLQIFVEEMRHPELSCQVEWAGGILNPRELARLGEPFDELRQKIEEYLMVFPNRDVEIDGVTKDEKKLFAAKAIQIFLNRLDKLTPAPNGIELPMAGGWLGNMMIGDEVTSTPILFPFKDEHIYVSGIIRFGKSTLARTIVENALIEQINVLIIEPTKQWAGLGKGNDDPDSLARFDRLGIGRDYVRGFDIKVFTPKSDLGLELPENPESLLKGCSVVILKDLNDTERCITTKQILEAVYYSLTKESKKIELMIVLEEASVFLPQQVSSDAKDQAKEARTYITRITREKGKYGCIFVFITQSLSDFKGPDAHVVRGQVGIRLFLRATDRTEHEYIENYVSKDAVEVVKNLKRGEAFLYNSDIPGVKFYVRPPFSAVREPTDEEIREVNRKHQGMLPTNDTIRRIYEPKLTEKEAQALSVIREYFRKNNRPILAKELAQRLKIQGGTRQRLLENLLEKKLVKKVEIPVDRGRPVDAFFPNN